MVQIDFSRIRVDLPDGQRRSRSWCASLHGRWINGIRTAQTRSCGRRWRRSSGIEARQVSARGRTDRTSSARSGSTASSGTVTTPIDSPSALKSSSTHPRGPDEGWSTKSTSVATSPARSAVSTDQRRFPLSRPLRSFGSLNGARDSEIVASHSYYDICTEILDARFRDSLL